jgi:hypothetical protein
VLKRILAGLLVIVLGGNGLVMLLAGPWWYGAVPGVTGTGPYNPHFVKDIGAAYLVCGGAALWRALRPAAPQGAMVAAAAFLLLHAAVHVADAAMGMHMGHDLTRDFAGVFVPAFIAAWLAWPSSPNPGPKA